MSHINITFKDGSVSVDRDCSAAHIVQAILLLATKLKPDDVRTAMSLMDLGSTFVEKAQKELDIKSDKAEK